MITTNAFDYINLMDKAADASWMRESLITNNIANVDTPGYKRQDVDFASVLKKELGNSKFGSLDKRVRALNQDLSGLSVSPYTIMRIIPIVLTVIMWMWIRSSRSLRVNSFAMSCLRRRSMKNSTE